MRNGVSTRPACSTDDGFLRGMFGSTLRAELTDRGWGAEFVDRLISQQYDAQRSHYARQFPGHERTVVLVGGAPAGRLDVARLGTETRILEIGLLPRFQNQGVGTELLRRVLTDAAASGRRVVLEVACGNRAQHLYRRLGFRVVAESEMYTSLEWS